VAAVSQGSGIETATGVDTGVAAVSRGGSTIGSWLNFRRFGEGMTGLSWIGSFNGIRRRVDDGEVCLLAKRGGTILVGTSTGLEDALESFFFTVPFLSGGTGVMFCC
jgi:hypothetical protein